MMKKQNSQTDRVRSLVTKFMKKKKKQMMRQIKCPVFCLNVDMPQRQSAANPTGLAQPQPENAAVSAVSTLAAQNNILHTSTFAMDGTFEPCGNVHVKCYSCKQIISSAAISQFKLGNGFASRNYEPICDQCHFA